MKATTKTCSRLTTISDIPERSAQRISRCLADEFPDLASQIGDIVVDEISILSKARETTAEAGVPAKGILPEFSNMFDGRFRVVLFEELFDRRCLTTNGRLSRDSVGKLVVIDSITSEYRAVSLTLNRYVLIWAMVMKHLEATPGQLLRQGRDAVTCSIHELGNAYGRCVNQMYKQLGIVGMPGDEISKGPGQIADYLTEIKHALDAPYTSAIHAPTPYFINALPGRVFFYPRPLLELTESDTITSEYRSDSIRINSDSLPRPEIFPTGRLKSGSRAKESGRPDQEVSGNGKRVRRLKRSADGRHRIDK